MPLLSKKNEYFFILLIVFLSVALSHTSYPSTARLIIIGAAAVGLVFHETLKNPFLWTAVAIGFLLALISTYSIAANHTFLCTYLSLSAIFLSSANNSCLEQIKFECRIYIFIIMAFATAQKLITPYYTSGELIADYIMRGHSYYYIFGNYVAGFSDLVAANNFSISALLNNPSPEGTVSASLPSTEMTAFIKLLSWCGIVHEGIASILMIVPLGRFRRSRFWILLLLIIGIYLLRNETAFLSLIAFLGMWFFRDSLWKWRTFLVVLVYLCLCTLSGFRPYFLS